MHTNQALVFRNVYDGNGVNSVIQGEDEKTPTFIKLLLKAIDLSIEGTHIELIILVYTK